MSEHKFILSIDNGLTVTKSAIFDFSGNMVASSSEKTCIIDSGLQSEINMPLLWDKTCLCIRNTMSTSGINPLDIAAVGNTGYGCGIFLIDRNGNPVRNAITSIDSRAIDYVKKINLKKNDFYKKTNTNMWPSQAIPLLCWLKDNENENFGNIYKILMAKDWIKYKLTNTLSTDYTETTNAGLINLYTRQYDEDLYRQFGLEKIIAMLSPIKKCEDISGFVTKEAALDTGLYEGTPVVCGLMDVMACSVGGGISGDDKYSIIAGTWSINTAIRRNIIKSPDIMACMIYSDSKNYLYEDASPTSAVNLEWFLKSVVEKTYKVDRKLFYKTIDDEIEKIIKSGDGLRELFYFPFIYKSKLSNNLNGAFIGFNSSTDVFELIYAIYQGIVFAHLMHIENLKKGGISNNKAILSGGAAKSRLWCQMFADILDLEISTTLIPEVGLLGAAIYALIGIGQAKDLKDAQGKMVRMETTYFPDKTRNALYKEKFSRFKNLYNKLEMT